MEINELQIHARDGDKSSEDELFRLLSARFKLFARQRIWVQADAEEIVQEALKTVFEKYREIDFETSFSAWAYQVLNHKLLTYAATKRRREKKMEEMAEQTEGQSLSGVSASLERRLLDCLQALNQANHRHARILNLHYQGFGTSEICSRLGLTRTNFYSIMSRARSMLEACLKKGETE